MAKKKVETSLVLRTTRTDMTSMDGFKWPDVGGTAIAPDWVNNGSCGHGLHGWLYGQGDHSCSGYTDETAKWLVVEVETSSIVMLVGKCKFPQGVVRFIGERKAAADYIIANESRAASVAVIGAMLTVGDSAACIVGALGTATAGRRGTATAGDSGEIRIRYLDEKANRYRTKNGYIGEDGLEPNTPYCLDEKFNFVKAQ